jgi:uncharacterized membrane protein
MPFLGAAIGGATGAAVGSAQDFGVDDDFMRKVGAQLVPGSAAVFTLVSDAVTEKVLPELAPFGGQIIQTSLSPSDEEHLKEAAAAVAAHAA